jgi:hypothetical protein
LFTFFWAKHDVTYFDVLERLLQLFLVASYDRYVGPSLGEFYGKRQAKASRSAWDITVLQIMFIDKPSVMKGVIPFLWDPIST